MDTSGHLPMKLMAVVAMQSCVLLLMACKGDLPAPDPAPVTAPVPVKGDPPAPVTASHGSGADGKSPVVSDRSPSADDPDLIVDGAYVNRVVDFCQVGGNESRVEHADAGG
jgi:hypothetical protein